MLIGDKVYLRPIVESDTKNIVSWRNKDSVRKNFFFQNELTEDDHLLWYQNRVKTGEVAQFIIIDKERSMDIGSVFLRDIDRVNSKAEYGVFIGEDAARGQGFGSEAASLICRYGFSELKLHRIFLRVFTHNIGAIASYKKAGFSIEGTLKEDIRVNNKFYDVFIMAQMNKE